MKTPASDESSPIALMAQGHAARRLAGELARETATEAARPPSIAELARHALRRGEAVADMALERYLRRDPQGAARYRRVLAQLALAHSPVAIAASSGAFERRIGAFHLTVLGDDAGDAPLMVLRCETATTWPTLIVAQRGEEDARLPLGPPIGDQIIIVLDPGIAETAKLARLLRETQSELYLL